MRVEVVAGMPTDEYRSAHGVNQSSLKKLARSPEHLRDYLDNPKPSTPDQIIGSIFDIAVFNPGALEASCHVKPANYQNSRGEWKKWTGNAKECRDWIAARDDKPIISQANFEAVWQMRDQVFKKKASALALKTGVTGTALFLEDAETGLQLKALTDWISGNTIVDLKSCQDASRDGFSRTVAAFGYDIQAAFYLDAASLLGLDVEHFVFIAVEKAHPFAVAVWELDSDSITAGRSKYRRLLNRYMQCVAENSWPGYSENIEILSIPEWAKRAEFNAQFLEDSPALPALEVSG